MGKIKLLSTHNLFYQKSLLSIKTSLPLREQLLIRLVTTLVDRDPTESRTLSRLTASLTLYRRY